MTDSLKFPPGAEFRDVEGIPVSLVPDTLVCRAWDGAEPRAFPVTSFWRTGEPVSRERFDELVASAHVDP